MFKIKLEPLEIPDVVTAYPFRSRTVCETFVTIDRRGNSGLMFIRASYAGGDKVFVVGRGRGGKEVHSMTREERHTLAEALGVKCKDVDARAKELKAKHDAIWASRNVESMRTRAAELGFELRKIKP